MPHCGWKVGPEVGPEARPTFFGRVGPGPEVEPEVGPTGPEVGPGPDKRTVAEAPVGAEAGGGEAVGPPLGPDWLEKFRTLCIYASRFAAFFPFAAIFYPFCTRAPPSAL